MVSFPHVVFNLGTVGTLKHSREDYEIDSEAANSPQVKGIMPIVNFDNFLYHLTLWIVNCHVAFSHVEHPDFQALLESLNSSVNDYLVRSGYTIRNWLEDDLMAAKRLIREEVIAPAISKIHVSCDLWTSPNGYAMCVL